MDAAIPALAMRQREGLKWMAALPLLTIMRLSRYNRLLSSA